MKLSAVRFSKHKNLVTKYFPLFNGFGNYTKSKIGHSKSQFLMLRHDLIFPHSNGLYHILPYTQRCLDKLIRIIEHEMTEINCLKMSMSALSHRKIWEKSERWSEYGDELIKLNLGAEGFCLSPTHEEEITNVVSTLSILKEDYLPLRLYQISNKYRDEMRSRFGLLRAREFLMKDLYTFDSSYNTAMETYQEVCEAYENIFKTLGLKVLKAKASGGNIGGDLTHEYHIKANIGEDKLVQCMDTGKVWKPTGCHETAIDSQVETFKTIEIGHTFFLGTLYTEKFEAFFFDESGETKPLEMGCYGIGVSRLLAACLENFSTEDCMRFPMCISPFKVCIIPPKQGSKESNVGTPIANEIYEALNQTDLCKDDVIIDNRISETVGWRLKLADALGYPVVVLVGKSVLGDQPKVEVFFNNRIENKVITVTAFEAVDEIINEIKNS